MRLEGESSYSAIDEVCGRLVHLVPMDDSYIATQVQWASRKLSNFALAMLIDIDIQNAKNLISATKGVGSYGSLRGYLFENLAHQIT